jgi:formate hydrogenlyase subunit 4
MSWVALVLSALVLAICPVLPGIATRTRAVLTGRKGPPVLQLYHDLWKLLRKQPLYSITTGWIFRAAPVVLLVSTAAAVLFLPLDGRNALAQFPGDLLAFAGLLGLGRFTLVLAGLDTGSSFEGMGASREVFIGAFVEPVLFLCLSALVLATGEVSMSRLLGEPLGQAWSSAAAPLVLVGISLFVLLLAENARVPVDDPATHLELTMIHEVMVLDHGGPDLALIHLSSSLKLGLFAALIVGVLVPRATVGDVTSGIALIAGMAFIAVAVGIVESAMARLRLNRIPQLLVGAGALALLAVILLLRPG